MLGDVRDDVSYSLLPQDKITHNMEGKQEICVYIFNPLIFVFWAHLKYLNGKLFSFWEKIWMIFTPIVISLTTFESHCNILVTFTQLKS